MIEDQRTDGDRRDPGARSIRALTARFGVAPPAVRQRTDGRYRGSRGSSDGNRDPNFVTLWIIVSSLWTLATCLRIERTWNSWSAVLGSAFAWVSLVLPPLVFALLLIGISRVARRPR